MADAIQSHAHWTGHLLAMQLSGGVVAAAAGGAILKVERRPSMQRFCFDRLQLNAIR